MAGRTIRHFFVVTAVAASVLAACGGGGESANDKGDITSTAGSAAKGGGAEGASAKSLNGCELVTATDAEAIFGVPVIKSEPGTQIQQMIASCVWDGGTGTGNMALVNKLLQLHVYEGSIFYTPDQHKEMPGFESIDGIGDGAYATGTGSFDLTILSGKRTVSIGASGFTPDGRAGVRQAVLDVASKVLDRM